MLKYIMGTSIARQAEQAIKSVERRQKEKIKATEHEEDSKSVESQATNLKMAKRRQEVMEKRRRNANTCLGV